MQHTSRIHRSLDPIRRFIQLEASGGITLVAAAALAMIVANLPWLNNVYQELLATPVEVKLGALHLKKNLLLVINDGLMAVFFLLVGLEIKREVLDGELASVRLLMLPGAAAVAGIGVPALIYAGFNRGDEAAMAGWAIPAATDIAFALGVLSLLGKRVPISLKVFLTAIAVIDDLAAILIIAIFYSGELSVTAHILAACATVVLIILNRLKVTHLGAYFVVGTILWVCVLKSGIHATIAGVVLALCIPLRVKDDHGHSPLRHLEHMLHPWVAFGILPLFAFANAGVSMRGVSIEQMTAPIPLGIAVGLVVGKMVGVFSATWLIVKSGLSSMPTGATWGGIFGVSLLCGIGFTMSLFIGTLAFANQQDVIYAIYTRIGVLGGSIIAAIAGYIVLYVSLPRDGHIESSDVED